MEENKISVSMSVAVFETPEKCGVCPMYIIGEGFGDSYCGHPSGPGLLDDDGHRRDKNCPLKDFLLEAGVTVSLQNNKNK